MAIQNSTSELDLLNDLLESEGVVIDEPSYAGVKVQNAVAVVSTSNAVDDDDEYETLSAEERAELDVDASGGYPKLTMNGGITLDQTKKLSGTVTGYLVDVKEVHRLSWNEPDNKQTIRKIEDALTEAGFDLEVLMRPHQIVRTNWRSPVTPDELSGLADTLDMFKRASAACDHFVYSFKPLLTVLLHVTCMDACDEQFSEIFGQTVEIQVSVTSMPVFKAAWADVVKKGKVPLNEKAMAAGREPKIKFNFKKGITRQNSGGKSYELWSVTTNA